MNRLFVAIDLPEAVREQLSGLCMGIPGALWASPEQMHLTLRFIGEVDNALFGRVLNALGNISVVPLTMSIAGLGYFPPHQKPNVLWAGIRENEALVSLRNKIEHTLVGAGLKPDARKFHAHITLARLQENTDLARITEYLAGNSLLKIDGIEVNEFHLYSSRPTREGHVHCKEATYELSMVLN